jgi:hypothetical protein
VLIPPSEIVVTCPLCSYAVITFSDAVEALEGGGLCLLCGGNLDSEKLRKAIDTWKNDSVLAEGRERALDKSEWLEQNEWVESGHDFGDEGEDEEDESWPTDCQ